MVFNGDTNDVAYSGWGDYSCDPGEFHIRPGWGWIHGSLGFSRHGGKIMLSYIDGHAKSFAEEELQNYHLWHDPEETSGAWMLNYIGDDGCGGTRIHSIPPEVMN